jgi:hypothetical protein
METIDGVLEILGAGEAPLAYGMNLPAPAPYPMTQENGLSIID